MMYTPTAVDSFRVFLRLFGSISVKSGASTYTAIRGCSNLRTGGAKLHQHFIPPYQHLVRCKMQLVDFLIYEDISEFKDMLLNTFFI
jgi:hypothetical protein